MPARMIAKLEEGIIALLLVAMTLMVAAEVVMRLGFSSGVVWLEELTLHAAAWFVLFGAAYGVKTGAHICVDAVTTLLPSVTRRIIGLVATLLCLLYCAVVLAGALVHLGDLMATGIEMEDIPVPKWVAQSILFFGFILLAVRFGQLLWAIIQGKSEGYQAINEAGAALEDVGRDKA